MRFECRVAIVFGAGSSGTGLSNGRAIALALAREGAEVFAADINLSSAEETARQVEQAGGVAHPLQCDVASSTDIEAVIDRCCNGSGAPDIVINNVGIADSRPVAEIDDEAWQRVLATNLSGVFFAARAAIPRMSDRGGAIVNVASIAALQWLGSSYPSYSATKAGVIGLTRNLAIAHAHANIRINCVLPGFIDTANAKQNLGIAGDDIGAFRRRRNEKCPMGRMGTVWDVANAVAFLASDQAAYITGTELVVDGGLSITTSAA